MCGHPLKCRRWPKPFNYRSLLCASCSQPILSSPCESRSGLLFIGEFTLSGWCIAQWPSMAVEPKLIEVVEPLLQQLKHCRIFRHAMFDYRKVAKICKNTRLLEESGILKHEFQICFRAWSKLFFWKSVYRAIGLGQNVLGPV